MMRIILVLCSFAIFSSCFRNTDSISTKLNCKVYKINIEKEIVFNSTSGIERGPLFLDELSKSIGNDVLLDSSSIFLMRVWIWDSLENHLLVLHERPVDYELFCIDFKISGSKLNGNIKIERKTVFYGEKDLKKRILDTVIFKGLDSLRVVNVEKLPVRLSSMYFTQIEFFRRQESKYLEYLEPSFYRNVDVEYRKAFEFLNYLSRVLPHSFYDPPSDTY
jgi:hypothetical protein